MTRLGYIYIPNGGNELLVYSIYSSMWAMGLYNLHSLIHIYSDVYSIDVIVVRDIHHTYSFYIAIDIYNFYNTIHIYSFYKNNKTIDAIHLYSIHSQCVLY